LQIELEKVLYSVFMSELCRPNCPVRQACFDRREDFLIQKDHAARIVSALETDRQRLWEVTANSNADLAIDESSWYVLSESGMNLPEAFKEVSPEEIRQRAAELQQTTQGYGAELTILNNKLSDRQKDAADVQKKLFKTDKVIDRVIFAQETCPGPRPTLRHIINAGRLALIPWLPLPRIIASGIGRRRGNYECGSPIARAAIRELPEKAS
jgi:hypothetical protein